MSHRRQKKLSRSKTSWIPSSPINNRWRDWTTVRVKRKARLRRRRVWFVQLSNRWMSKDDWRSANSLANLPSMLNRFFKEKFFSTKSLFNCIEIKFVSLPVSLSLFDIRSLFFEVFRPSRFPRISRSVSNATEILQIFPTEISFNTVRTMPEKTDRQRRSCLDGNGRFKWFSTNKFGRVFRHSNGKRSNRRWSKPKNIANSIRNNSLTIESVETKPNSSKSVLSFLFEGIRHEWNSIEDFRETIGSLQPGVQSTSDRNSSRKGEIREEERFLLGKNLSLVEFNKRWATTRFSSSPLGFCADLRLAFAETDANEEKRLFYQSIGYEEEEDGDDHTSHSSYPIEVWSLSSLIHSEDASDRSLVSRFGYPLSIEWNPNEDLFFGSINLLDGQVSWFLSSLQENLFCSFRSTEITSLSLLQSELSFAHRPANNDMR